jgi:tetratricopeptide (TPR) repeat protein
MTESEALEAIRGDDPAMAARAEAALWQIWCRSGIPEVDALLREGMEAVERRQLKEAEARFTRIIERAPDFAEGWNKRATVRYLQEDYTGAIADCEETLARNPNHFGALSGQGLCHMALGQYRQAAAMFRRALDVHPHLGSARHNLAQALR